MNKQSLWVLISEISTAEGIRWATGMAAVLLLPSCGCLPKVGKLDAYSYSINHPRAVKIYRVPSGSPTEGDVVYAYLRIENTSANNLPISFGHWNKKKKEWQSVFKRLKPVVTVVSNDAPIVGEPEILLEGLSSKTICAGSFFPKILPDSRDFPLNEANYDRSFAIRLHPDRSRLSQQGSILLRFKLGYINRSAGKGSPKTPEAIVRIPISISPEYRPETITTTPSVIPNE